MTANRKNIKTQYGKVHLIRTRCPECGITSLVLDGKTACCDVAVDISRIHKHTKMVSGAHLRKRLTLAQKSELLKQQEGKCFYCRCDLNSTWYMSSRMKYPKLVTIEYDHIIPFIYSQEGEISNIVASCNVCNMIKHDRMFETIEEIRSFILAKRESKGYVSL